VEKYCTPRQVTDNNMAHALCMLDNLGYKHTLIMCNTHCFSTTIIVARKWLIFTSYVYCLYCYVLFILSLHATLHFAESIVIHNLLTALCPGKSI
jgi:hypothetical protein